tara:strand:+ start:101 stop:1990 length:1890 start_codon:yes stop_codon:yes gene_type:complete
MRKKRLLFQTDFSLVKTGFARMAKSVLKHLYKTGKYDITHYCCGMAENAPALSQTPWKSIGCVPSEKSKIDEIQKDPILSKNFHYGSYMLDEVVKKYKPDVYIAAQDIWGIDFACKKHWFNKIESALWTTLDSLPILQSAIDVAPIAKNYWIWSDFATKELHKLGHTHVKTVHGCFDDSHFHKLSHDDKISLRKKHNIPENSFIIGFVFRNQLRKTVYALIEGFKKFTEENPQIENPRLLLHTSLREGWGIKKFMKQFNVPNEQVLFTHVCANCKDYVVQANEGNDQQCPKCGSEKSLNTVSVQQGVTEAELNEVYNLMDVYCHPFTSGGQEIPIQEAKLCELITLVTSYSCGEEMCYPEAHSLPLEWDAYREFGTDFVKSNTKPESIFENIQKVYDMSVEERSTIGKKGREWALKNFSDKSIGGFLEDFIDSANFAEESIFEDSIELKDPKAKIENIENDKDWVKHLYKQILKIDVSDADDGVKHWVDRLNKDLKRENVEEYFRNVAAQENTKKEASNLENYIDKNRKRRILFLLNRDEKSLYLSTSLLKSVKKLYPSHDIYFSTNPNFFSFLDGNEYIYKMIPYVGQSFNVKELQDKYFDMIYAPDHFDSAYDFNGNKKIEYDLCFK